MSFNYIVRSQYQFRNIRLVLGSVRNAVIFFYDSLTYCIVRYCTIDTMCSSRQSFNLLSCLLITKLRYGTTHEAEPTNPPHIRIATMIRRHFESIFSEKFTCNVDDAPLQQRNLDHFSFADEPLHKGINNVNPLEVCLSLIHIRPDDRDMPQTFVISLRPTPF